MAKIISCDFNNPEHTQALVDLMNHYMLDKMGDYPPLDNEKQKLLIEGLRKHPSKLVLLAEEDGKYLGLVNCFINFGTFDAKPFINIHDIIVLNTVRGKGIGRMLMQAVSNEAEKQGCCKITLEVRADNTVAQSLYKSFDYKESTPVMHFWTKRL